LPKSEETFIQRQLKKIAIEKKEIEQIESIEKEICNEVKSWSSLKLIFLNYVADIYSKIMGSDKSIFKDKHYFIDLFSGSGIGKVIDSQDDIILGSPLMVATQNKNKFTKMFFCDINTDYINALKSRLNFLNFSDDNFNVFPECCNKAIDKIIPMVKGGHSLIFIDPYGMEITWKSMEKLLSLDADIIMNFQTVEIPRAKQNEGIPPTMENFFKDKNEVKKIYETYIGRDIRESLLEMYKKDMVDAKLKHFSGAIIGSVRIKKDDRFYYDLIFLTKQTSKGNPWLKPIIDAGDELEKLNANIVQEVLSILKGRQKTLLSWLKIF